MYSDTFGIARAKKKWKRNKRNVGNSLWLKKMGKEVQTCYPRAVCSLRLVLWLSRRTHRSLFSVGIDLAWIRTVHWRLAKHVKGTRP